MSDVMIKRINLRDWREQRRQDKTKEFARLAAIGGLAAAAVVGLALYTINGAVEHQQARNNLLNKEIRAIDRKIKEIEELERVKANLLARMRIIEELQASRAQTVHFFDEIVSTLPEGVHLTEIKQQGKATTINGIAESNGRVSTYLKNLDASEWFASPRLVVIKTTESEGGRGRQAEFTVQVTNVIKNADGGDADDGEGASP